MNVNKSYKKRKRNILTRVIISLARSLARSGLMKHDNPDKARPASYWFWLFRSLRIMLVVSINN